MFTGEDVHGIQIQYFDTIAVCSSICVLKTGDLFAAAEVGNHAYYTFLSIGNEETNPVVTDSTMARNTLVTFLPRNLKNLQLIDELDSLSCITDMKVDDLTGEGNPQIYVLCGASKRSSLRVLRHGLSINELAVSPLPGRPIAVWTIKNSLEDELDKYIILSFRT